MATVNSVLQQERDISKDISEGLESALKGAKNIDYEIARSFKSQSGILYYVERTPLLGRVVTNYRAVKPLSTLESELRGCINTTLIAIGKIGTKIGTERERIAQLKSIYETAESERWDATKFLEFIEANTDLDFKIVQGDQSYDLKDLFAQMDALATPEKREENRTDYLRWFKDHTKDADRYLSAMQGVCQVSVKWVGVMSMNYFDLTQLRSGMEDVEGTMRTLSRGGLAATTTQDVLRSYGTAYVNGMISLVEGYNRVMELRSNGSTEFESALSRLTDALQSPRTQPEKPKSGHTLLLKR